MKPGLKRTILSGLPMMIIWVACVASTSAQAVQQQKPQMAEEVFKNIPALKGIPVDEFMDTMGLFSAALGMNCTDCHTPDSTSAWANFASETPLKQKARRMTLMVNNINKNNFGGVQAVTCFTCHQGDRRPRKVASLAVQYSAPFEEPNDLQIPAGGFSGAPSADEVFNKYIQAVGGPQRISALTSFVAKGTYEGYDTFHVKSPIEIYAKAAAQRTSIAHLVFGDKITVFDGRNGWFSSPDKPSPLISLTGGNLEGARLDAMVLFPAQIKQMATQWRVGTASIDDKDVVAVQGTSGNLPPVNLYFDETTGLLLRMTRFADTAVGTVPTQTAFSDYRDVVGVKVPFRWVTTWTDNETVTEFTEIQLNATIEAAKFARPAPAPPPKLQ
jgi:hypothetical protein